jgi:hypothetical protein
MYIDLHVKWALCAADFNDTRVLRVSKNTQISNFVDIRQVGAELLHADGLADITEAKSAKSPRNSRMFHDFSRNPSRRASQISDRRFSHPTLLMCHRRTDKWTLSPHDAVYVDGYQSPTSWVQEVPIPDAILNDFYSIVPAHVYFMILQESFHKIRRISMSLPESRHSAHWGCVLRGRWVTRHNQQS